HSTRVPRGHGALATVTTSGSTGRPLSAVKTALQQTLWNCLTLRDHMWQRRDLTAKLAVIRGVAPGQAPYPRDVRYRAWGRGTGLIHATGPAVMLSAEVPLARQLDWLQRENPGYLLTNPSNLHELVRHATATGVALPDLRGVGTLGGILRPEVRTAVRATWNVGIADIYSAQETGYLALQCPDHPHYHVQAETILLEILDPDGHPCAPGETGRVVVTPLHAFAMPLIRYDIGDYAEVGAPCPCGRGLPVLRRVIGRVRNMLVLPSGARIAPTFVNDWYEGLPVRQFQIVQHAPDHLEFRIVAARAFTAADEATVRTRIAARLAEPMRITFGYLDAIPRGVGGKFEDFKCEVPPATSGETVDGH
ncbi:MAG: phenylacetate--CoA ligase family protein, partial [Alphaproteobacteria bacterium]